MLRTTLQPIPDIPLSTLREVSGLAIRNPSESASNSLSQPQDVYSGDLQLSSQVPQNAGDSHFSHSFNNKNNKNNQNNNNNLDDRDHFLQNATASVASLRLITSTPAR